MRISPVGIEAMLHYYYSPEPHQMYDSTAVREATAVFLQNELVEPRPLDKESVRFGPPLYQCTEKGRAWVEMICTTPLPQIVWINPNTRKPIYDKP